MFIFSSFGTVIFSVLALDQNRKSLPCDDGWVELALLLTPFGIKLFPTLWASQSPCNRVLRRELRDSTRGDLFLLLLPGRENRHG